MEDFYHSRSWYVSLMRTAPQRLSSILLAPLLLASCGARSSLSLGRDGAGGDASGGGGTGPGTSSVSSVGGAGGVGVGGDGAGGLGGGGEGAGGAGAGGAGGGGIGGVEQLALGAGHTCLRTFEGEVFCWGRNANGQLGDGTFDDSLVPVRTALDAPATYLAAGTNHACSILDDERVVCWGRNDFGQLGVGAVDTTGEKGRAIPETVPLLDDGAGPPRELALGDRHTCAVRGDRLQCWGSGALGAIGTFDDPVPLPFAPPVGSVAEVSAGGTFTCLLPPADPADPFVATIACMGNNSSGQCGVAALGPFADPVAVAIDPSPQRGIATGLGSHACALVNDELWCWGANGDGQLGRGTTSVRELPGPLALDGATTFESVAPGFAHTCAIQASTVWCWGDNGSGQLGGASNGPFSALPAPITSLGSVVAIGAGSVHSCAYVGPQEVWCWGGNDFGQLGTGDTIASDVPVLVALP